MARQLTKMEKDLFIGCHLGIIMGVVTWEEYKKRQPTVIVLNLAASSGSGGMAGATPRDIFTSRNRWEHMYNSNGWIWPEGFYYESFIWQMRRYYSYPDLKAVCLKISSPGRSLPTPGQSVLLAEGIRDFSSNKNIPVYAFVEDVATSGGYFLAFGAKEIYAKESSIVKRIGVKQTLGLQEIVKWLGLDNVKENSFVWRNEMDIAKESRGDRLMGAEDQLFSGDSWTANEALQLGIIDGVENDMDAFLKSKFGDKVRIEQISA